MTETPANTPEPAATPPTPTALAVKAFMARIDRPTYRKSIETTAILGGWVGSREAGCWDTRVSDAIVKAALDRLFARFREWAAECGDMEPLDGALVPYLDWPLGFTYGVHCDKQDCAAGSCDASGSGMVAGRDYGTVRELLADIKAHAEAASEGQTAVPAAGR